MNVYYDPENYELSTVGEVEFSSGCYEFDLTVVWRDASGQLYYADDFGCSCPVPFEGMAGLDDLTKASPAEIQAHLEKRADRKSTRLNSSHPSTSYAVFCSKTKNINA